MQCGILILAAGGSTRMRTAKQTLVYQGSTLLKRAVNTALASVCTPVVVVLGSQAEQLNGSIADLPVIAVNNPNWERGMGTSIRCGVSAIQSADIDAIMILLCDQPLISTAHLDRMVQSHFASNQSITAAAYANVLGTPAIFSASHFAELLSLDDAQGGKSIFGRHPGRVNAFEIPEAETDLDTPEDYRRLTS